MIITRVSVLMTCAGVASAGVASAQRPSPGRDEPPPVIHHSEGQMSRLPVWTVSDPVVEVGEETGSTPHEFFRVTDVRTLADGMIAVVNSGSQEIRMFTSNGAFVRTIGGQGQGPGEFMHVFWLFPVGPDSMVAWDTTQNRASVFAVDGSYGRQVAGPTGGGGVFGRLVGIFGDGGYLFNSWHIRLGETVLTRYSEATRQARVLGEFPGTEAVFVPEVGYSTHPLFSPVPEVAVAVVGDSYWVAIRRMPRLERFDTTGTLQLVTTWEAEDRPVTRRDVDAYWASRPEGTRRDFLPVSDEFPVTSRILPDALGHLWVEAYPRPGRPDPQRWFVVGPTGRILARVELPRSFDPTEIGVDHILGYSTDDLGVQRVERRDLRRPP